MNEARTARAASTRRSAWRALGPGLVFAGAAIGVSHLVQATRAGAEAGLAFAPFIAAALFFKFPAFSLAPRYAAARGQSLLAGYLRLSPAALLFFCLYSLATMAVVLGAVTFVTAGLVGALVAPETSTTWISVLLLGLCALLLGSGRYAALDRAIKVAVAVLTLGTLVATFCAAMRLPWRQLALWPTEPLSGEALTFLASLMGWMPAPVEIAVWHSLWTLARPEPQDARACLLDTMVGYLGTALLAFCFLVLGTAVFHGRDVALAGGAAAFATQLIQVYGELLGDWARPLLGGAALAVMFSTTITIADAYPRALAAAFDLFRDEGAQRQQTRHTTTRAWVSRLTFAVSAVGAVLLIACFHNNLGAFVDFATLLAFLSGPIFAWLNHRVVFHLDASPIAGIWMRRWSVSGIAFLIGCALFFLYAGRA